MLLQLQDFLMKENMMFLESYHCVDQKLKKPRYYRTISGTVSNLIDDNVEDAITESFVVMFYQEPKLTRMVI